MSALGLFCEATNINFPNLGIELENVGNSISVFGFEIAYYGIVIAIGMLAGYAVAEWTARRTGQDANLYLDFALWAIIISVICARIYYVVFNLGAFSDRPLSVFNLRTGGLAIYGGVIGGIATAFFYAKWKKVSFPLLTDTAIVGLLTGQIIGRWGNFFNREAFGTFTDGLFAMQVDVTEVSSYFRPDTKQTVIENLFAGKPQALANVLEIRNHAVAIGDATYIQVQPTFLYESTLNLCLLIFLLLYTKRKKFDGEILLWYLFGYGLIRVWIEGMRTDQLFLWNTSIPVSQLLSVLLAIFGAGMLLYGHMKRRRSERKPVAKEKNKR